MKPLIPRLGFPQQLIAIVRFLRHFGSQPPVKIHHARIDRSSTIQAAYEQPKASAVDPNSFIKAVPAPEDRFCPSTYSHSDGGGSSSDLYELRTDLTWWRHLDVKTYKKPSNTTKRPIPLVLLH